MYIHYTPLRGAEEVEDAANEAVYYLIEQNYTKRDENLILCI